MTHVLGWVLIGWVALSALAAPLVGRFLAIRLPDPEDDEVQTPITPLPNLER